jgi:creatinine amidohydrolase
VRLDLAAPGPTEPIGELLPTLRAAGVRAVSPNGVLGDPRAATAEAGAAIAADLVDQLVLAVKRWRGGRDR